MPELTLSPDATLFYREDDLSYPWEAREAAFLLHGNAESGVAWNRWIPFVAPVLRTIRPDMRGFGQSTPMPADHAWSLDEIGGDYLRLADHLGIERFHCVAAKVAGPIAARLAVTHPDRVKTLTVIGSPMSGKAGAERYLSWLDYIDRNGVEAWARWTMDGRLGSAASSEMMEGWIKLMGATARSTQLGFIGAVPTIDMVPELPRIACPTLVIATDGSALRSVDQVRAWQETIPVSELLVVESDSYHVAVTEAEICARATLAFIARHSGAAVRP